MSNNKDQERQELVQAACDAYEHYTGSQPETTEFAYIQAGARDEVNKEK
jgi:hypothetical protein